MLQLPYSNKLRMQRDLDLGPKDLRLVKKDLWTSLATMSFYIVKTIPNYNYLTK